MSSVTVSRADKVAIVKFNDPQKLNALTASMGEEDRRVFNLKVRCIVNAGLFTHAH